MEKLKGLKKGVVILLAIFLILGVVLLAACTQPRGIRVQFNLQGGTGSFPTQTIQYGETIQRPSASPARDNHTFVDWYTLSEGGQPFDFSLPITRNTTIFARWQQNAEEEFVIAFRLNFEGAGQNPANISTVNARINPPNPNPTRGGFLFNGWWTSNNNGITLLQQWDFNNPFTANTTLFADWVEEGDAIGALPAPSISVNGNVLSWNPVPNVRAYMIEVTGPSGFAAVTVPETTATTFTIPVTVAGVYTARIRSLGDGVVTVNSGFASRQINHMMLAGPFNFSFDLQTDTLSWDPIERGNRFIASVTTPFSEFNVINYNLGNSTQFDMSGFPAGNLTVSVTVQNDIGYLSSTATHAFLKLRLNAPRNISISDSLLTWDPVPNANAYTIMVGTNEFPVGNVTEFALDPALFITGENLEISIRARDINADFLQSNWARVVPSVTILFNSNGGSYVAAKTIEIGEPYGYLETPVWGSSVFVGWFTQNGTTSGDWGEQILPTTVVADIATHTLYARWELDEKWELYFFIQGTTITGLTDFGRQQSTILVPAPVTSIGNFSSWQNPNSVLHTVNFEQGSQLQRIGDSAFYRATSLTSITIPASVTSIGAGAFSGATSLQTVTFESGSQLQSIGDRAFRDATSLTSITIPASVTWMPRHQMWAFEGADNVEIIWYYNPSLVARAFTIGAGRNGLVEIIIPDGTTHISSDAFGGATLTSITIPASVTSMGIHAFLGWTHSQAILMQSRSQANAPDGMGITSARVFWNVTEVILDDFVLSYNVLLGHIGSETSITIPASVTSIGDSAFRNATSLRTVTFAQGSQLQRIEANAFRDATSLTSITIPASVTSIGDYAFERAISLHTVNFEQGSQLQSIGDWAFWGATALTSITIPASVTSIGNRAFSNTTSLTSITIPASVTSIGSSAFSGWTSSQTIYVQGHSSSPAGWDNWWFGGNNARIVWNA